jgi:acetylornithine deacetylase/succinyl-diaminopimelate desuccinylase-like protein
MSLPSDVAGLLQALVQIPSVNPAGSPGTDQTGEQACAEFVARFLQNCGAEVELQQVKPGRPNVIGKFHSPGKPRLLLAPHLDTVSVEGMTINPFGGELRDDRIYGRGASDTKGPMAAMLWAIFETRERIHQLPHEIWFAGLMGEEAGQEGAHAFAASHSADFAIAGEPTELRLVHAHKGDTLVCITTQGKAVHSSAPARGENAICKMLDLLDCFRSELIPQIHAIGHPALGSPTVSIGTIHGGSKFNIVPDRCSTEIDIRTVPGIDQTELAAMISGKLQALQPDVEIEFRHAKPLFTDPAHPFIQNKLNTGHELAVAPWFCDAAVLAEAGIPAIAAGPGSIAQAHTEDEWIAVADLQRGVDFYKSLIS